MGKKWEYLVEFLDYDLMEEDIQEIFNRLGYDGWELVSVTTQNGWDGENFNLKSQAYLKRELD